MKNQIFKLTLTIFFISFFALPSKSQIIVTSTDGYSVEITITPTSLHIYGGDNCKNGYNYDINFDYTVKLTGDIPSKLYTLQGTFETANGSMFFNLPNKTASGSSRTNGHVWTSKTDCKTADLQSTPIAKITIEIEGPGIKSQFIEYKFSTLPIELISFKAKKENSSVQLSWATATEINNDYFTIERSSNGIDFISVKNIKGAGNSNQLNTYTYSKSDIEIDGVYYRLKQTDYDGKFSYSSIVYVAPNEMEANKVAVYPNPSETNQIRFNANKPEVYTLSVSTLAGQIIHSTELFSNQITLPELSKGFYLLQFKNNETGLIQNIKYLQK